MSVPSKLKDRYEIRQVLGQGGMGVVYKAYDSVVKREVALKTLRDAPNRMALQLFYKECDVLASMSHPNIVEIFDIGEFEEDGASKPYFVMPLLPGVSLDNLISTSSHRLTVERSVDIITQACRGLQAAHERGLVHRDLKPSNLFVMEDDSVKIIDFGLAHIVDSRSSTGQKGTLLYMAPEQIEMKPLSSQTDIYALGLTAYETLTRRLPFERGTVAEIAQAILRQSPPPASDLNPAVNQAISRVVHKAMAKQPFHRFSSMRDLADSLQKALRNEPIEFFDPARTQPRIERATRAFEQGDYQFASEILSELEAEGHIDPEITRVRRQIDQASRRKAILQLLESARRRMEEEEFPLALQKIQEVLDIEPDNADALSIKSRIEKGRGQRQVDEWLKLARQHLDNYAFSHARQAIQNVLEQNSVDSQALSLLSDVDRREREYNSQLHEKDELYQAAMDDYHKGEFSTALNKLERVLDLDRRAPNATSRGTGASYQNFYNQVRSEREAIESSYAEARMHMSDGNFAKAQKICEDFLIKYPGHALFQALKFDVQEQERQQLSSYIAEVDRQAEGEPDLDRRVDIVKQAAERYPEEPHFKRALKLARDKRDLVNSIVAKAQQYEERTQFNEALGQWEILRTIYSQYPGLNFEIDRVKKRREQQSRVEAKARWVQQIDLHLEAGDHDRAAGALESALKEFPGDAELMGLGKVVRQAAEVRGEAQRLLTEAQELCGQGKYEEGLEALRRAHLMDLQNPVARAALAETLAERARAVMDTDCQAAEAFVRDALDLDPAHPLAKSLRTLVDDRKREEAVEQCVSRARQLQSEGNLEGALSVVEQGISAYPHALRLTQLRATLRKSLTDLQRTKSRHSELGVQRPVGTGAETVVLGAAADAEQTVLLTPNVAAPPPRAAAPEDAEVTVVIPPPGTPPAASTETAAPPVEPATPKGEPAIPPHTETEKQPERLPPAVEREPEPERRSPAGKIAVLGLTAAVILAAIVGYQQGWFGGRQPSSERAAVQEEQQPPAPPVEEPTPAPAVQEPAPAPAPLQAVIPAGVSEKPKPASTPPARPAASKEVTVSVSTNPPGAKVIFDENPELSCASPCSLPLSQGRHTATLSLAGYRTALKIWQVPKDGDLKVELTRTGGNVQVSTNPPGATVLVNGQPRSEKTPATLILPVGSFTISVVKEGYRKDEQSVDVKDGALMKLDFTLGK